MTAYLVGLFVFACTFVGAMLGIWLRNILPGHHLDLASKDTVKVGIGLVATMTALVLGLVTASAKSSFDAVDSAVRETSIELLTLDRMLARYGPETAEIRTGLKRAIAARIDMMWSRNESPSATPDPIRMGTVRQAERLVDTIRALNPRNDAQRALQARAIDLTEQLLQARWMIVLGTESSVPVPFLAILVCWLTITFTSFGLFAPRNATVVAVFFLCALSVASAVFLILEMDTPFSGLLRISPDAMRYTYEHLNL